MKKIEPIFVHDLLSEIDNKLIDLLKNLSIEDWSAQTLAPKWKVKDVAVHLLDGNLRTLSMLRDNYYTKSKEDINSNGLINYLNQLNADWVQGMKRLSPKVIIDLLAQSGKEYCEYLKSLDPFEKATFSVAWAGENESQNWFHIAREYTEKWHHQQQIRLATDNGEELLNEKWYLPYLETSIRALPYHYRNTKGKNSDIIKFTFQGDNSKDWFLKWQEGRWELLAETNEKTTSEVIIKDKIAWRVFTKGIEREKAIAQSKIIGNTDLGQKIFELVAVMA